MIRTLTGAAAAALIAGSAAHATMYQNYSDDPGVVRQAPYETGFAAGEGRSLYVPGMDRSTFGLMVEGTMNERATSSRAEQSYRTSYSDDPGVVLQAPYQTETR